jgi:hypothetical protein
MFNETLCKVHRQAGPWDRWDKVRIIIQLCNYWAWLFDSEPVNDSSIPALLIRSQNYFARLDPSYWITSGPDQDLDPYSDLDTELKYIFFSNRKLCSIWKFKKYVFNILERMTTFPRTNIKQSLPAFEIILDHIHTSGSEKNHFKADYLTLYKKCQL